MSTLLKEQTILTPHVMELSRLLGISVSDITNNLIDTARQCSYNNKLIYAIKDARTIVTQSNRKYMNVSGNNGMATGGSGDVLTGILTGLLSQGYSPEEAAILGVYLHGLSGDLAVSASSEESILAGDIADYLGKAFALLKSSPGFGKAKKKSQF